MFALCFSVKPESIRCRGLWAGLQVASGVNQEKGFRFVFLSCRHFLASRRWKSGSCQVTARGLCDSKVMISIKQQDCSQVSSLVVRFG